ncbi:MAG: hypothetical protein QM770_21895 [Tepidisphaeraceae bacterium]
MKLRTLVLCAIALAACTGVSAIAPARSEHPATKPTSQPDWLPKLSKWAGTWQADERRADANAVACRLHITERDAEKFDGVLRVGKGRNAKSVKVHGETRGNEVRMKATVVIDGAWNNRVLERIFMGQRDGDTLSFRAPLQSNVNADPQAPRLTLKRQDDAE